MAPGSNVTLNVLRNGEEKILTLTLGKMPGEKQARTDNESKNAQASLEQLGLAVASARASGAGDTGVVVRAVDPDRPAGENGIKPGDIIRTVDGKAVASEADVRGAVHQADTEGKHCGAVQCEVVRGNKVRRSSHWLS